MEESTLYTFPSSIFSCRFSMFWVVFLVFFVFVFVLDFCCFLFFSFLFSFRQKDLYVLRVAVKNVFKSITYRTYVSDLPTCFILEFMRAGYYLRQSVCLFNVIKS